jgi:hypothetical protein
MMPPWVRKRTVMPFALQSVTISTIRPSGSTPNDSRVALVTSGEIVWFVTECDYSGIVVVSLRRDDGETTAR